MSRRPAPAPPRPRRALVAARAAAALLLAAPAARADRYEASLHATAGGGLAQVAQEGAATTATATTVGASARLSHAWRDRLAWDVQLAGALVAPATFAAVDTTVAGRPVRADLTRRTRTIALQLGAQLRLGTRWIPTLRLAVGPQLRHRSGVTVDGGGQIPARLDVDAAATVGLGLERRLGAHLLVGLAVEATRARPVFGGAGLATVGLTVTVSRAWYPRIWGPTW
ncbi:MAG: hypothetical protein R3B06_21265 [Kofleriaceae bacterium]